MHARIVLLLSFRQDRQTAGLSQARRMRNGKALTARLSFGRHERAETMRPSFPRSPTSKIRPKARSWLILLPTLTKSELADLAVYILSLR